MQLSLVSERYRFAAAYGSPEVSDLKAGETALFSTEFPSVKNQKGWYIWTSFGGLFWPFLKVKQGLELYCSEWRTTTKRTNLTNPSTCTSPGRTPLAFLTNMTKLSISILFLLPMILPLLPLQALQLLPPQLQAPLLLLSLQQLKHKMNHQKVSMITVEFVKLFSLLDTLISSNITSNWDLRILVLTKLPSTRYFFHLFLFFPLFFSFSN